MQLLTVRWERGGWKAVQRRSVVLKMQELMDDGRVNALGRRHCGLDTPCCNALVILGSDDIEVIFACRQRRAEDTPAGQGSRDRLQAVRLGLTPGSSDNTEGNAFCGGLLCCNFVMHFSTAEEDVLFRLTAHYRRLLKIARLVRSPGLTQATGFLLMSSMSLRCF